MVVTVKELWADRTEEVSATPSAEIHFYIDGADNEAQVKTAAIAGTPKTYANMPRVSLSIDEHIQEKSWKVTARYDLSHRKDISKGEIPKPIRRKSTLSFDTSGGSEHIEYSLSTVNSAAAGGAGSPPNMKKGIGFESGHLKGVDVITPIFNFSITKRFRASQVTDSFKANLYAATGTVNASAFQGFAAGDVLFLGARGSPLGEDVRDDYEITFSFSARRGESVVVGDIFPLFKRGWEYAWLLSTPVVDASGRQLGTKPVSLYIESIYPESAFAFLGIGS